MILRPIRHVDELQWRHNNLWPRYVNGILQVHHHLPERHALDQGGPSPLVRQEIRVRTAMDTRRRSHVPRAVEEVIQMEVQVQRQWMPIPMVILI